MANDDDDITDEQRIHFLSAIVDLFIKNASEFDVSTQDVLRMMAVSRAELVGRPHNISSLANELGASVATTSRWLDRMIHKNILVKEPNRMQPGSLIVRVNLEWRRKQAIPTQKMYQEFIDTIVNSFPK